MVKSYFPIEIHVLPKAFIPSINHIVFKIYGLIWIKISD